MKKLLLPGSLQNSFFAKVLSFAVFFCAFAALPAQPSGEFTPQGRERLISLRAENSSPRGTLALRKLSLYASGVGFFEYQGTPPPGRDGAVFTLPFSLSAVDDALKSLMVVLPRQGDAPLPVSVTYPAFSAGRDSLFSGADSNSGIAELLRNLRGEEVEISAPGSIRGRILAVEYRYGSAGQNGETGQEVFLSLLGDSGIRVVNLKDISGIAFRSEGVNASFRDALDRIMENRNDSVRDLRIGISGNVSGPVRISYVVPVPVWKVSYRLDLSAISESASGESALLQGWAIVDNDSDTGWEEVELSLVSGRPVSFIQNLYAPYHVYRPVYPLSIAGTAEARAYDGALAGSAQTAESFAPPLLRNKAPGSSYDDSAERAAPASAARMEEWGFSGGTGAGTAAQGAGLAEQFQFTLTNPVTIGRRQSAMIPLVESAVAARKTLIFSGARARGGAAVHPAVGAELVNTTGMKLPAGPLTIYDGGSYAGDALVEFFPDNDRRLISWGEDLSVTGAMTLSETRTVSAVTVSRGVMTITRRQLYETVYTIRNSAAESKSLVLEHPRTPGTSLAEPAQPREQTNSVYRFWENLPENNSITVAIKEERPLSEQIALARLGIESLVLYASNREIPATVRAGLERAVELRRAAAAAQSAEAELESRHSRLAAEQDRIRRNLEAAGNQSPQGQEYLRRLSLQDAELDSLAAEITGAGAKSRAAQRDYENYLEALQL